MDRRWPHGCADGGAAGQGRIRRLDLEPHARQGRDRGAEGREGRRLALRARRRRRALHHAQHRQGRRRRLLRRGGHVPRRPEADAEDAGRLLDHRHGRVGGGPERPRQARREVPRRAGQRQSEMRARRKILLRRFGSEGRLRAGEAAAPRDRAAGRDLCRRGRARAHVQDRRQPAARGHHREHDGGDAARAEGRREAQRLPGVPERQRRGLDLHPLQDAGARQSRLDDDVPARRPAQGRRSRPGARPPARSADADHGGGARDVSGAFRRRQDQAQPGSLPRAGLRHALRDDGADRGRQARERERAGFRRARA